MTIVRVTVDRENVNDEFVIVRKIYGRTGALVAADDPVMEVETSKTIREILSPASGTINVSVLEGDEIAVGGLLFEVAAGAVPGSDSPEASNRPVSAEEQAPKSAARGTPEEKREFSRAAERLAQDLAIPADSLPTGWVVAADVLRAAGKEPPSPSPPTTPGIVAGAAAAHGLPAAPTTPYREERKTLRKRTESRNLLRANGTGSTSMIGIEISAPGPRLVAPPFLFQESITDLIVFEAAKLLRRYPDLNAYHLNDRTIAYYEQVNFGISFDRGHDLKVLALRDADTLSLADVQAGIERLLHLYESDVPIETSLLNASTVTITDLSRSPADFVLPLLNAEQSLIIAVSRRGSDKYALHAALDHRVSEGLQVAKFIGELRQRVESHHHSEAPLNNSRLRCAVCEQSLQQELKLGRRGLISVVLADGKEGHLCRNCFDGW